MQTENKIIVTSEKDGNVIYYALENNTLVKVADEKTIAGLNDSGSYTVFNNNSNYFVDTVYGDVVSSMKIDNENNIDIIKYDKCINGNNASYVNYSVNNLYCTIGNKVHMYTFDGEYIKSYDTNIYNDGKSGKDDVTFVTFE